MSEMENLLQQTEKDYCENLAAKSGSSFYYSFLFLEPDKRQAITAIYAFCRVVDDIVDECSDKNIASQKLSFWHDELNRIYTHTPTHPIGIALTHAIKRFALSKSHFEQILKGMWMDLRYQGYQTFDDLKVYCQNVASAAGLLAIEVFGYQNKTTEEYANYLGIAFQLVNIIRDVGEDIQLGRVYLPEDELKQFNLTPTDILNKNYSDNFIQLMRFQANRARKYYDLALQHLESSDKKAQKTSLIMAEIYFTLLTEIEKSDFKVLNQKIGLTPFRKLWIAWRTYRRLRKSE